jgi:hypothetical protein
MKLHCDQNNNSIGELVNLLDRKRAVLLAGAGCGAGLGYPDWLGLLDRIQKKLELQITFDPRIDVKDAAEQIKAKSRERWGGDERYHRCIREEFQPKTPPYLDFHLNLVSLGFAGITTTNYDTALENAVPAAFFKERIACNEINLCDKEERYRVLAYLGSLGHSENLQNILHLHGCYKPPQNIVLTRSDYERYYGKPQDSLGQGSQPDNFRTPDIEL